MPNDDATQIRNTAELLISNAPAMSYTAGGLPPGYDIPRTHSINLITEEFLGGYMQDGRMSVIRRFFCLFVTFDLIFVSLLWLICIMINGDNIFNAFQKQIVHYTIYTSLADVVAASLCRFLILIFFYALLYINHWFVIAFSTSGSCLFLISKVFVFDWVDSKQQVFEVILIITSFVLAWGEAWFLDCRVIPQERHARRYFNAITTSDRTPLVSTFLAAQEQHRPPDSVANFYSPLDSAHNSDDEEQQDEEYHQMGLDCVRKVYDLIESSEWKLEKVTKKGDTIHYMQREKLGKVFKLTARIKYPAKLLMDELFYKVDEIAKWNPTVLESRLVRKINSYTDITYQASAGGGGGLVKSRDFVNLRCWRLVRNGRLLDATAQEPDESSEDEEVMSRSCEGSVSTVSDNDTVTPLPGSLSSEKNLQLYSNEPATTTAAIPFATLSKSTGARGFVNAMSNTPQLPPLPMAFDEPPPLEENEFHDANTSIQPETKLTQNKKPTNTGATKDGVWVSAAISIDYPPLPPTPKCTRGENIVTGFAFREIIGKKDDCIIEWILCLDLKGYFPRYVLDTAYSTFMSDYMKHMRKYVAELRQKRKLASRH